MNVEDLVRSIGELAYYYELTYHGCSQFTLKALQDSLNIGDNLSFEAATTRATGIAIRSFLGEALILETKEIGKSSSKLTIQMGAPK